MKGKYLKLLYILIIFTTVWSCQETNYPGGVVSSYIGIYDVRILYKGNAVTLDAEVLDGSSKITGVVVSDHRAGNIPEGLLILQDKRRLNRLRGIAIALGNDAANYQAGDSIVVDVIGGVLNRVDGVLQVANVGADKIEKVKSGIAVPINRVNINAILERPDDYESTLVAIVKGGFNPMPSPTDVLAGDKVLNDGFGNLTLRTKSGVSFADTPLPIMANYYGIVFCEEDAEGNLRPYHAVQKEEDIVVLSSEISINPMIITGFMSDVRGTDANHEYIQFMATEAIDFAVTPYAVVTTNNANASTPTGYPARGWATGGVRTYKLNLTAGSVQKGDFFYVGGTNKMINGASSTKIDGAVWAASHPYNAEPGFDFGNPTANLLANSGNAFGMAIFEGTEVTVESTPIDVVFVATGGSLYTPGPPALGYRIANTDFYDIIDPISLNPQPFYRNGTNTNNFVYNTADLGFFNMLGGVYDVVLGRWTTARRQVNLLLTKESVLEEIEGEGATVLGPVVDEVE